MKALAVLIIAAGAASALFLLVSQPHPAHDIAGGLGSNDSLQVVFENATNLTNKEQDSIYGQVAAWNSGICVIWQDSVSGRNYDIFMKKSTDNSTTFGSSPNLSKNEKISECPSITMAGDNIYVVWEDLTPRNHEVLYAKGIKM